MASQIDNITLNDDTTGFNRTVNVASDDLFLSVDLTLQSGGILTADNIKRGTADPNVALVPGNEGDLYQRTLATTGELWVNTDGTTTGWSQVSFVGGGSSTWAATLATGNVSGGTNPILTNGDSFRGEDLAGAGGVLALVGGAGAAGIGGAVSIVGGAGAGGTNAGGAIQITSGASSGGEGGAISLTVGASASGAEGGDITLTAGTSTSDADGGRILLVGGVGGGNISITAGTGIAVNGAGGDVSVTGGSATGSGEPGTATLRGGASGTNTSGGTAIVTGGNGDGTGDGGISQVLGGSGGDTGDGGLVEILGGDAGSLGNGLGGDVTVTAGDGVGTGDGGDVIVNPGVSAGSGARGIVQVNGPKHYANSATDPTVPAPADGDRYYNTSLDMEMRYDAGRAKWLSVETSIFSGSDVGALISGAFLEMGNIRMTAAFGYAAHFNGTVVSLGYTRGDSDASSWQVTSGGTTIATVATAAVSGVDTTLNADFSSGAVLGIRNGGVNTMSNTIVWVRVKWRV